MKVIYKFPLEAAAEQTVPLRHGCKPLHVNLQPVEPEGGGEPFLQPFVWVELDDGALPQDWVFLMYGTGHPMENRLLGDEYVGTFQLPGFVFHVYSRKGL